MLSLKLNSIKAKETKVYVLEWSEYFGYVFRNTTLYNHILRSQEKTLTPLGYLPRVHLRVNGHVNWVMVDAESIFYNAMKEPVKSVELWTWGETGKNPIFTGESFLSIEEGEEALFQRVYAIDFLYDNKHLTDCYADVHQALQGLISISGLSINTARSIMHHRKIRDRIKACRSFKESEEKRAVLEASASIYATMIEPRTEPFKETVRRLSEALEGKTIDSSVFWIAVKQIRTRYKLDNPFSLK